MASRSPQARWVLRINGIVATAFGTVLLLAATPLARALGSPGPAPVVIAGVMIALLGVDALLTSVRRGLRPQHVVPFAIAGVASVGAVAGIILRASDRISGFGLFVLAGVAVVAGVLALLEVRAAKQL